MKNMVKLNYWIILACAVLIVACGDGQQKQEETPVQEEKQLYIVATTGMIADAASNIVGDLAKVESLMGPGVDPHLYKATQGDLTKLNEADIILYNGIFLEGKMEDILLKLGKKKPSIAVGDAIDRSKLNRVTSYGKDETAFDPHVWFNVRLWLEVVNHVSIILQKEDPENAETYKGNATAYIENLKMLDKWVREEIATIPEEQRVLVTAHDAFGYFGKAYDIEVKGLQGISTVSEFGLQDIKRITDMLVKRNVKAVFVESSVSDRSLKAVIEGCKEKGHEVKIGGTLYSDAMGQPGTVEGTYLGMVKHNVKTIVEALK